MAQSTVEGGPWNSTRMGHTPPPHLIVWVFVLLRLRGVNADFGVQMGDFDYQEGWGIDGDGGRTGTPLLWAPMEGLEPKPPELPDKRWAAQLLTDHMKRRGVWR